MNKFECIQGSLLDDILLKILSSLQASDVCALSSCSRFWRDICGSDYIWANLFRDRWPALEVPSSSKGWKDTYIMQHSFMAESVSNVINFVEDCSTSDTIEVGNYLKAIEDLCATKAGFKDVQMFLFRPRLNAVINLLGLHYTIDWLSVPAENVLKAVHDCKISERLLCIRWHGRRRCILRLQDDSRCCWVSLGDLVGGNGEVVLQMIRRGGRIQISIADPTTLSVI